MPRLPRPRTPSPEAVQAAVPFIHLTAAVVLVTWGLEAALPFSVWRLCLGFYALLLFGWEPIYTIGRFGLYLVGDVHERTRARLNRGSDE